MGNTRARGREPPKGATFESVWALLQENARQQAEQKKEIDRIVQENAQRKREIDRQMKETAQQMKETDRRLGDLGLRMGEMAEYLMTPKLHKKFNALGFCFNHSSRNHELRDHGGQRLAEVDLLLENGEYVMAVEVKNRLSAKDVKDHVKRMETLRRVADEHSDKRSYLGAVAGMVVTQQVLDYAVKSGFYVIIPSGSTVDIAVPGDFKPKIW
ncbi:MAG: hypothetical protein LBP20_01740 [Treponema sp.]|jgi:hypothetical protein|nr:hypothetical protein [Treponema sp.]